MGKLKAGRSRSRKMGIGEGAGEEGMPELLEQPEPLSQHERHEVAGEQPTVTITPVVYFATAAMSALLTGRPNLDPRVLAHESFHIAEAMLHAARERGLM